MTIRLPDHEAAVVEVVEFVTRSADPSALEAAIQRSIQMLREADGYRGHAVGRSAEHPATVMLLVYWKSLEAHIVDFRESPAGRRWRAAIDPHLAEPPRVMHCLVTSSPPQDPTRSTERIRPEGARTAFTR